MNALPFSRRQFVTVSFWLVFAVLACGPMPLRAALPADHIKTSQGDLAIYPMNHASLVTSWNGKTIYVDPVGGAKQYSALLTPDLILITDIHGDHLHPDTLLGIVRDQTTILAPEAVAEKLPDALRKKTKVIMNGQSAEVVGAKIEAVPMYNLTQDRLNYHPKGRGNGYVVTLGGKRIYISGDTEDIPEMRQLKNIDVAFVCMNLPYTMDINQAASAVLEFKPKIVYPYHSRGSDVEKFREMVSKDSTIEVRLRDWYKASPGG